MTYVTRTATATARDAGRNVVHTVTAAGSDGSVQAAICGTRRSAHWYRYAICRWRSTGAVDDHGLAVKQLVVDRWSRKPGCSKAKGQFAVEVTAPN